MNTCFSKRVLQLQLEGCNEKTRKITIMRPLSALMKTYQTPNMHLQNVIVFFYQKMKTKRLLTLCEFFLISKRGQGQVILDPTLPHPTVLHTKNSCYSCSYNLFAKKKNWLFFFVVFHKFFVNNIKKMNNFYKGENEGKYDSKMWISVNIAINK